LSQKREKGHRKTIQIEQLFCIFFVQLEALIFNCQYPHNIFSHSKSGLMRVLRRYSKWGAGIQNSGYIIRAAALMASSSEQ
jgi:hypothetical protein